MGTKSIINQNELKSQKNLWEFVNEVIMSFRNCFTRKAAFHWFVVILTGIIVREDHLGVTSIIRGLWLKSRCYETMLHFFRAHSWNLQTLRTHWIQCVQKFAPIYRVADMPVLIGDGVKAAKEGRKMPGVKRLRQESENSAKGEYIQGHSWGVISVLIGSIASKAFSLPLFAEIHDGVEAIRDWGTDVAYEKTSHVVQIILDACTAALCLGSSILPLDSYYLSVPALTARLDFEAHYGRALLTIVTKAKMSARAYTKPESTTGRGRPRKKGKAVKLKLFFETHADNFTQATLRIYGKPTKLSYLCLDLLWGQKLYKELRFVMVDMNGIKSILVCTNLNFAPEQIIQLYSCRMKIEHCFRALKQTLAGFFYHFWTLSVPKLNKYSKKSDTDMVQSVCQEKEKVAIASCLKAIEGYAAICCIALGILQMVALYFSNAMNASRVHWLRTRASTIVSEATAAVFLRKTIFLALEKCPFLPIMRIIADKQSDDFDPSGCLRD